MSAHDTRALTAPDEYPRSVIEPQLRQIMLARVSALDLSPIAYKLMHPDNGDGSRERWKSSCESTA